MASICLKGVKRQLQSATAVFELTVPSFDASEGDIVAVVGNSGCGKSTLMDVLGLVSQPQSADQFTIEATNTHDVAVHWQKDELHQLTELRRKLLSYVMQAGGLFPYLSVRDNLLLPSRLKNIDVGENISLLVEAFNLVPPDDRNAQRAFYKKKPRHLSGGQRQRSAIIRALLSEPLIILADEPTAAVDGITAEVIVAKFSQLAREHGIIVIMVSHDKALVKTVANRAYTFELNSHGEHVSSTVLETSVDQL